jgi:uncharacterized protein
MRKLAGLLCLAILLVGSLAFAVGTPIPPSPTRWVTDDAGFMSPEAVSKLDAQIGAYSQSSGQQLIVYIGKTTGGVSIEEWAVKAFAAWKVGRKGLDDGLALFIMAEDRRLRIEVGYGLEGKLPDLTASRIINDVIVPRIQSGARDSAVFAGVEAMVLTLGGKEIGSMVAAPRHRERGAERKQFSLGQLIFFGIIAVLFLILFMTNPSLAIFLLFTIMSGGRGGGGHGGSHGGGGFSGGGGRSGGGGASGSW